MAISKGVHDLAGHARVNHYDLGDHSGDLCLRVQLLNFLFLSNIFSCLRY